MPLLQEPKKLTWYSSIWMRLVLALLQKQAHPVRFIKSPDPHSVGDADLGRVLCAGQFQMTGFEASFRKEHFWEISTESDHVHFHLHSFEWLDNLASFGTDEAANLSIHLQGDWIKDFSHSDPKVWNLRLTALRLIRWINHAELIGLVNSSNTNERRLVSLDMHRLFLERYWKGSRNRFDRMISLTALLCSGLFLEGEFDQEILFENLVQELENISSDLDVSPDRNPETLLETLTMLSWIFRACNACDVFIPDYLNRFAEKIGQILRGLRHANGDLVRFHGGAKGTAGRLDGALAHTGARAEGSAEDTLGYARLSSGSTTIVLDAQPPNTGPNSGMAHASTNAIEMNSGWQPIIVSNGTGYLFGEDHHFASRQSNAHSTLILEDQSSASFLRGQNQVLVEKGPINTPFQRSRAIDGSRIQSAHDGYIQSYGLMHARTLDLSVDGATFVCTDMLVAQSETEIANFERAKSELGRALKSEVRIQIHPDIQVELDPLQGAVNLTLPNSVQWQLSHDGSATLSISSSLYYQQNLPLPRRTQQIILAKLVNKPVSQVSWSLVKSVATS